MNSSIQFHMIHGEHVKLSKGNTVAKRVDSFCKGICFTQRPISVREKIHVRLLSKSVQWTGFLRLGMTTSDPNSHRTSDALPRHACPDLTCRPGYWAKCVPENCFDLTNKLTYFYVDENGELFLNSPSGEISLLTGISVREPLWGLLDIYGNCISIELVEDPQPRPQSLNGQIRSSNSTATMNHFQDLRSDLRPLTFLPVHNNSISFFSSSSTNQADKSIVLFDMKKASDGLIYFSEPLSIRTGLLIEILRVLPSNESRSRSTTNAIVSTSTSTHLQFGLTNCDIKTLYHQQNSVPLTINSINQREELWVIQDFPLANKTLDSNDEFLFVFAEEGIIYFSQNNSPYQDYLHLDPSLTYYPFLIFKGDVTAVRSAGFLRSLNKCRGLPRSINNDNRTASPSVTASNEKTKKPSQSKSNSDCSICLDRERDTVLIPCGHICLCYTCAKQVQQFGDRQCPICRSSIDLVNKIYLA